MPNARPGHEIVHESVPSPLYTGIENSRRFRALPLIASLMSLGRQGYIGGSNRVVNDPVTMLILS